MARDIGRDIALLELGDGLAAFAEYGGHAFCRVVLRKFVEQGFALFFCLLHPVMAGLQDHLRLRKVGRGAAQFADQIQQTLNAIQQIQIPLLAIDIVLRNAQVLELANGVVGRQCLGELLQRIESRIPILGFFLT